MLLAAPLCLLAGSPQGFNDGPTVPPQSSQPIRWAELGGKTTALCSVEDLAVVRTPEGVVRLRCSFQRLAGEVTRTGLSLTSTVEHAPADRFRVVADYLGRDSGAMVALPEGGVAEVESGRARYVRGGLVEEYGVSVDGIRQDLVVAEAPGSQGELRVELVVNGARARNAVGGVQLVLDQSGRKLAYGRLRVVDANGRLLLARMAAVSEDRLAVVVADVDAVYPVRIDPTFSDANWVSLDSGLDGEVDALAVMGGNLYAGGSFTKAGTNVVNRVAKWDGTAWSALGSGVSYLVFALAVSGTNLYAGGEFITASGIKVNGVAKWDGSAWSALASGVGVTGPEATALAVSGTNLYVGGYFSGASGVAASCVAKWDGSAWSSLGSGVNGVVTALAVSGTDLYVAGHFTKAGGVKVRGLAKWDGSAWSSLGSGTDGIVSALAVSGADLYVGGFFYTVGASYISANNIAKWDGKVWSALGSGLNSGGSGYVYALAVSGTNLYVGGQFTRAGGSAATNVAQWDGSTWSALGSGVNGTVHALAPAGANLFAGGAFTTAGRQASTNIAKAQSQVTAPGCVAKTITVSGAKATLKFLGTPGLLYDVQRTLSLNPPVNWVTVTTNRLSVGTDGSFSFVDSSAPDGAAYYRGAQP